MTNFSTPCVCSTSRGSEFSAGTPKTIKAEKPREASTSPPPTRTPSSPSSEATTSLSNPSRPRPCIRRWPHSYLTPLPYPATPSPSNPTQPTHETPPETWAPAAVDLNTGHDTDDLHDQKRVTILTNSPQQFVLQVTTAHTDTTGTEKTNEFPLTYYSGEHGAFLVTNEKPDKDHPPRRCLIPATRTTVQHELLARHQAVLAD